MFYKKWTKDPWCEENKAIVLLKVSCTRTQSCININFYKYEHVYNINLPAMTQTVPSSASCDAGVTPPSIARAVYTMIYG